MSLIGSFFGKLVGRFLGDQGAGPAPETPKMAEPLSLYSSVRSIPMVSVIKPIVVKEQKCLL